MNSVHFACLDCKNYIDAGYRWAATALFPEHWDRMPIAIAVEEVLACSKYWAGEADHPYLATVLPAARRFLSKHAEHRLVYGDFEAFMDFDGSGHSCFEWLDEDSLAEPSMQTICLEPRYFAEHPTLRYTSWTQVEGYCASQSCEWTDDAAATEAARRVFLNAVERTLGEEQACPLRSKDG
ncbi:hypothetical protein [Variovorax boronicumulans]|uniref:hypothetical protein n=1 Tax=Variovorax boronicumulans TaxID=436515 RepID=UPI0033987875